MLAVVMICIRTVFLYLVLFPKPLKEQLKIKHQMVQHNFARLLKPDKGGYNIVQSC